MDIRNTLAIAVAAGAAFGAQAQLEKLLIVDLSVANEITITATSGASAADVSGSDSTGVLLANFYGGPSAASLFESGTGDLVAVGDSSDGSPGLFNSAGNAGLNFWSWTNDSPSNFVSGQQAFSGSATWSVDPAVYAAFLAGSTSGDILAFADTDDDVATAIGTWNVIPAPASAALLGLGGLAAARRRR